MPTRVHIIHAYQKQRGQYPAPNYGTRVRATRDGPRRAGRPARDVPDMLVMGAGLSEDEGSPATLGVGQLRRNS